MSDKIAMVGRFFSEIEAQIAKSKLEAAGIDAYIFKDDAGGMQPQLQLTRGVRLMVKAELAETARELIRT